MVRVDSGFGEALIGALAGGGVAVARHEVARLARGCLDLLRGRGRGADELARVLEAFAKGTDAEVAKELEALPAAVRSGASAQLDEALTDTDDPAEAAVTRDLVQHAELIRDKLVEAGVLIQSKTGTVVYRPRGPVAIGDGSTAVAKMTIKGNVQFGVHREP